MKGDGSIIVDSGEYHGARGSARWQICMGESDDGAYFFYRFMHGSRRQSVGVYEGEADARDALEAGLEDRFGEPK